MAPVVQDRPQHLVALERANRIRLARADVKRRLAAGTLTLDDALDEWSVGNMLVFELVSARRRWGPACTSKAFAAAGVSETKTVDALTPRQRRVLLTYVK